MAQREAAASRGGFLPLGALRARVGAVAGLACLLAWSELLLCFEGVLRDLVELEGGLVHDPFFFAMTLTAGLAFLASATLAPRVGVCQRLARLPWTRCAAVTAGVGAVCSAAAVVLAWLAPQASLVSVACGVGAGLFAVWATQAWGRALHVLDLREALVLVSAAFCLQWVPLLAVPCLGYPAKAALVALLAVATCVLLVREMAGELAMGTASACMPQGRAAAGQPGERPAARLAAMSATMFVLSLVVQLVWCFFIKMLPGRLDVALFPGVFAVVLVVGVALIGTSLGIMERQGAYRLELLYRFTMLFTLCGVAATGVAAASDSSGQLFAMYVLVYLGYSLLGPTMWLLALGYAHMCRERVGMVLGYVLGLKYLGLFGGFEAVEAMRALGLESQGPAMLPGLTLACVALVAVAYLLVFPERELLSLSPLLFGMSSESVERRCAQISAECGLTPRESEVFVLLARGRDVGYICEELVIARNTVNVHRKSIYAKLGIHSQQELLSVVEGGA